MAPTFLSADQIFDGEHWLAEHSCLVINDGNVEDIISREDIDSIKIQHYPGILSPGFVNCHCHLELSHLKDQFPQKTGLRRFLQNVVEKRQHVDKNVVQAQAKHALESMHHSGIVAIGDIANTLITLELKDQQAVYIHTFVEALGMSTAVAERAYRYALNIFQTFKDRNPNYHNTSIAPHSPYAISKTLFQKIHKGLIDVGATVTTMHNQEWLAENEFYNYKTGEVVNHLNNLGIDYSDFEATGKNSLPSVAPWIEGPYNLILVHNTQSTKEDLNSLHNGSKVWLCLCPNANLYIEDKLPDVLALAAVQDHICIGTDSLASNTSLSVWAEILTLQKHFPSISLEQLLKWATFNGAKALNISHQFGKIAKNKRPGIVHIPQPFAHPNDVKLILW